MPSLLFPIALAALTALIIPLVLHLARRDEQKPTLFAALAWLRQKPKPQQRLRFDEWPLLALRLLLLILLAVFLARPVLFNSADTRAYIAVVPGLDAPAVSDKARVHWLAPGFPTTDRPPPAAAMPVASLLRQLDAELPARAKLTVYVPAEMQGDAERIRLSRAVDWRIAPGVMPAPAVAVVPPPPLVVRYAPDQAASVRYFRATAAAWQSGFSAAPVSEPIPADTKLLIWLAAGPLPTNVTDWGKRGGTILTANETILDGAKTAYWRDDGAVLIEGQGRIFRFTRPLTPAAMPQLFEADFPQHLRDVLVSALPAPTRVDAADYAPVAGGASHIQPARDLQPWLAVLIGLVLLAERWLATSRRRGVAP